MGQFITNDGTDNGKLTEVKQFYTQDGKTIEHPAYTVNGNQHKTITDDFCNDWVATTQDGTNFEEREEWVQLKRPLMQEWCLSCLCGMIIMRTCFGSTPHTRSIPPTLVLPVVLAQRHLVSRRMLNPSKPVHT